MPVCTFYPCYRFFSKVSISSAKQARVLPSKDVPSLYTFWTTFKKAELLRDIHLTEWRWPNHDNNKLIFWIWLKLKPKNLMKLTNLNFIIKRDFWNSLRKFSCQQLSTPLPTFLRVKLMFVGVMNFGQIQKIRIVIVKIFRSYSNQFSVISIWSS